MNWTKYVQSDGFDLTESQWNRFIKKRRNKMSQENYPDVASGWAPNESLTKAAQEVGLDRNRNPPVRIVVEAQIKELELQIKQRKELLEALDANKGVEDVLDKMRKLHL